MDFERERFSAARVYDASRVSIIEPTRDFFKKVAACEAKAGTNPVRRTSEHSDPTWFRSAAVRLRFETNQRASGRGRSFSTRF